MKKTHINIHHTATKSLNDERMQFDTVNLAHKTRFGESVRSKLGYYGGYHYLIERNGITNQFRGDDEVGAHNDQNEMNYKAIGICFAGNLSEQEPTPDQLKSAYKLIMRLKEKYKIADENITGHRDHKATQCPGNYFGKNNPWQIIKIKAHGEPEWFTQNTRPWAETVLEDVDGFIADPSPYKILELIRKVSKSHPKE